MLSIFEESQRLAMAMVKAFGAVGLNLFHRIMVSKLGKQSRITMCTWCPDTRRANEASCFGPQDYPHTPVAELEKLASELRGAL